MVFFVVWRWLYCVVVFVFGFEPGVPGSVRVGKMGTFLAVGDAAEFDSVH